MVCKILVCSFIVISLISCGSKNDSPNNANKDTINNPEVFESILRANETGGCSIRLVTPSMGETVDLTNGKTYEVAWTTDATGCETPFYLCLAGNPTDSTKLVNSCISFSANNDNITKYNGRVNITAAGLDQYGIASSNGIYHWVVVGFYGSHPASQSFRINK